MLDLLAKPRTKAGGLQLPGAAGSYASCPDANALDITGDIDLRWWGALDNWASTQQALIAKWHTTAARSYILRITASGFLNFVWTTAGSSGTTVSVFSTAATGLANGATKWVRSTIDVDNGLVGRDIKFWMSDDGVSWTQLGTTVTTVGVTSIFAGTAVLEVGSNISGTNEPAAGRCFAAEVRNGIDGTVVASPKFATQKQHTRLFVDDQGNPWSLKDRAVLL